MRIHKFRCNFIGFKFFLKINAKKKGGPGPPFFKYLSVIFD